MVRYCVYDPNGNPVTRFHESAVHAITIAEEILLKDWDTMLNEGYFIRMRRRGKLSYLRLTKPKDDGNFEK